MNKFYKNLFKHNLFYLTGILILIVLLFLLKLNMEGAVLAINQKNTTLTQRSSALGSLAVLRDELERAAPHTSFLENILPPRDQLLSFSFDLESLAKKSNLEFGFSFGEEISSTPQAPGYINFRLTVKGKYDDVVTFIKNIEKSRYFVDFINTDLTLVDGGYSAVVNGKVFFQ